MPSSLRAVTLQGLRSLAVNVEVAVQRGLPNINIVGLPDLAVRESKDRIRAAFDSLGLSFPRGRVTVSLSPAEIKKSGASFDLPIAVALLMVQGDLKAIPKNVGFIGELGLDGSIRPVSGIVPLVLGLRRTGCTKCYLGVRDAKLACHVPGIDVIPVADMPSMIKDLESNRTIEPLKVIPASKATTQKVDENILDNLVGLDMAKRALTIAAAGGHHLMLIGSPGTGKSALAKCLSNLLPEMREQDQLEVNALWSISSVEHNWKRSVPFRAPHHGSSAASILGGGSALLPGDISLSHRGVLFLDEFTEFSRDVVEQLRQPLEDKEITLSRAQNRANYPADFQLIAACNPCACGYAGDRRKVCVCTPSVRQRYQQKLSGPIVDRIDMVITVLRQSLLRPKESPNNGRKQHQKAIDAVKLARKKQIIRAKEFNLPNLNANLSSAQVRKLVSLDPKARQILVNAERSLELSARGVIKILRVARTIADLEGKRSVTGPEIAEALHYRHFQQSTIS